MLGYNEHEFLIGNMEVVNEFDTKSFQANASNYLKGDELKSVNFKTSFYSKSIASSIDGLKDITLDKEAVRDFSKVTINTKTLYPIRPIDYSDVTSIRPEMLSDYSSKVKNLTIGVIERGGSFDKIEADGLIVDEFNYTKKNIVKTSLDYRLSVNDILSSSNKIKKIIPDVKYIISTVVPFVNGFEKTRNNLIQEGKDLLVAVTSAENDIETTIGVNNKKVIPGDEKFHAKVNYLVYNGVYNTINIMAYVSYMYIRKVNEFRENVLNCNRLYTDLINGHNIEISESSEIGINPGIISTTPANLGFSLMQGNVAAYEVLANRVYELYSGKNKVSEIDDVIRLGDDEPDHIDGQYTQGEVRYNRNIYDNIKKVFIGIGQGLYDICQIPDGLMIKRKSESDKDIMNEMDIVSNAGFRIPLKDKYRSQLEDIVDISKIQYADLANNYGVDVGNVDELLSEVKDFANNMQMISNEVIDAYAILKEIITRFNQNINNEFKDVESVKEIEEWAHIFDDEFVDFVNTICGKFMERLAYLAIALKHIDSQMDNKVNDPDIVTKAFNMYDIRDYTSSITEMALEYEEYLNHQNFEALEIAYQSLRIKKETGLDLILEADENENPNVKAKFANKFSVNASNAIDKLKALITKIFDAVTNKFADTINQLANNKAVQNIKDNENKIVNEIDYNTIPAVNIYAYDTVGTDAIVGNLNKLRNIVKGFTPQVIQNINTEADLYQKLFPFVSGFNSNGDLKSQFLWFNKTGNAAPSQTKSISGDQLKQMVSQNMMPFIKDYTTTFGNNLKTTISEVKTDLENTISQYKTVEPSNDNNKVVQFNQKTTTAQPVAASDNSIEFGLSMFEADDPNKNTQTSMSKKAGWLNKAVYLYCTCTMNAVRDRYNDYVGILSKLAQVNTETPTQNQ